MWCAQLQSVFVHVPSEHRSGSVLVPHFTTQFTTQQKNLLHKGTELWRVSIGAAASWCHTLIAQSAEHDMNALDKNGDHATLYTGPECPIGNFKKTSDEKIQVQSVLIRNSQNSAPKCIHHVRSIYRVFFPQLVASRL